MGASCKAEKKDSEDNYPDNGAAYANPRSFKSHPTTWIAVVFDTIAFHAISRVDPKPVPLWWRKSTDRENRVDACFERAPWRYTRNRKLCSGGSGDRVVRDQVLYSNKCTRSGRYCRIKYIFRGHSASLLSAVAGCESSKKSWNMSRAIKRFLLATICFPFPSLLSLSLSLFLFVCSFLHLFRCRHGGRLTFIDAPPPRFALSIIFPSNRRNFMKTWPFSFGRN